MVSLRTQILALAALGAATASAAVTTTRTETCVQTNQIRSVTSVNRDTLRFVMSDRTIYTNKLRGTCSVFSFNGLGYRTRSGQLCNGDTIRPQGPGNIGMCVLGRFDEVPRKSG